MGLKINNEKAEQWIKSGAPENALNYLEETVKSMSELAEQKGILHKDEDDIKENDIKENDIKEDEDDSEDKSNSETLENSEDNEENNVEQHDNEQSASFMDAFSKSLNETITVAIKTYHDEVVVPLQKELKELANKSSASSGVQKANVFEDFLGNDWLPASVVATTIKEQFANDNNSTETENTTVTDEEVGQIKESVDKELNNDAVSGHAFSDF